jgi:hypothetical protein
VKIALNLGKIHQELQQVSNNTNDYSRKLILTFYRLFHELYLDTHCMQNQVVNTLMAIITETIWY